MLKSAVQRQRKRGFVPPLKQQSEQRQEGESTPKKHKDEDICDVKTDPENDGVRRCFSIEYCITGDESVSKRKMKRRIGGHIVTEGRTCRIYSQKRKLVLEEFASAAKLAQIQEGGSYVVNTSFCITHSGEIVTFGEFEIEV